MSAKVENHVTDIATGITVTATVQVGDISGRINCAKTAPKKNERFRIGQVRNHAELISAPPGHVINTAGRNSLFRVILSAHHHGGSAAGCKTGTNRGHTHIDKKEPTNKLQRIQHARPRGDHRGETSQGRNPPKDRAAAHPQRTHQPGAGRPRGHADDLNQVEFKFNV